MTSDRFERAVLNNRVLIERPFQQAVAACRAPKNPTSAPHLSWMLSRALTYFAEGEKEKAHRWLGFVQGVLAARGVSLEELMQANEPGVVFED